MDNNEYEALSRTHGELRKSLRFLWQVKESHLKEIDELLSKNWNAKTTDNLLYHGKQISLAFEEMQAVEKKIDHLGSRLRQIRN
tara:strand:- start:595 stop:846 length:252 start_codon:yes stop_codon:yes gene_type:complete